MKELSFIILSAILLLLASCDTGDATAYKDLVFGMTLEEVQTKGFCSGEKSMSEDGLDSYRCMYSDFAGCNYEKCELVFQDNKLAKIHFYNSTIDAERQRDIFKKSDRLSDFQIRSCQDGQQVLFSLCSGIRLRVSESRRWALFYSNPTSASLHQSHSAVKRPCAVTAPDGSGDDRGERHAGRTVAV